MAKEIQKYTQKSIGITPFGVDTDLFIKQLAQKDPDTFVVGNVKALNPKYGIDVLIKAFKIVKDANPHKNIGLEIIGEGEDREKLKKMVLDLNITGEVCFRGSVENHLLPEWYNSFSVCVSVSNTESFGVVAVEAMACECPVVVSDADGFTEVVVNNETGIIVKKKDPVATAAAIQMFIDNPSLQETYGKNGRKRVKELYDWNKNVDTMMAIYSDVLKLK
jgi:glycosyltransferase involved in cell wall biosynthesis